MRLFVAAAAVALGCGGNIGALGADAGLWPDARTPSPFMDAPVETVIADGSWSIATTCGVLAPSSPAAASCETEARACVVAHPPPNDTCPVPNLGPSLNELLVDCHIMCVDLAVAVSKGCVSQVYLPSSVPSTEYSQAAVKCANFHLLGTHWACAPADGTFQLTFGACVIIN